MRQGIWLGVGFLLVLLLASGSGRVQAKQDNPPDMARMESGWVESIFFDELTGPLLVCQRAMESWNRWHDTCHSLNDTPYYAEFSRGDVVENVLYDGVLYSRKNAEARWIARSVGNHDPSLTLDEGLFGVRFPAVVTNLGAVQVGGVSTTQYQYWVTDLTVREQVQGQLVYDFFVTGDGLVVKDQTSIRRVNGLTRIRSFSRHNTAIVVSAPPADQVQQDGSPVVNPLGIETPFEVDMLMTDERRMTNDGQRLPKLR